MSVEWIGGVMFLVTLIFIFTGFPVAFALGGTALVFIPLGIGLGYFDFTWMQALPQQVFRIMDNYTLLAVPFFIYMGTMLEKSGLAEDLLKTQDRLRSETGIPGMADIVANTGKEFALQLGAERRPLIGRCNQLGNKAI